MDRVGVNKLERWGGEDKCMGTPGAGLHGGKEVSFRPTGGSLCWGLGQRSLGVSAAGSKCLCFSGSSDIFALSPQ